MAARFGLKNEDVANSLGADLFGGVIRPRKARTATPHLRKPKKPAPRALIDHILEHPRLCRRAVEKWFPLFQKAPAHDIEQLICSLSAQALVSVILGSMNDPRRESLQAPPGGVVRFASARQRRYFDCAVQDFTWNGQPELQDFGFRLAACGMPFVGSVIDIRDIYRYDMLIYADFDGELVTELYHRIYRATGLMPGTDITGWTRPDGGADGDPPRHRLVFPGYRECQACSVTESLESAKAERTTVRPQ